MKFVDRGQADLVNALVDEIRAAVHHYDESMTLASAVGALEMVKHELIDDALYEVPDDGDSDGPD